jgi:PAS domain S-box-containing protein
VERTDSIFFSTDTEGVITYISPAIQNHTGYTPDEVIGNEFMRFIHPEDAEKIIVKYQELLRNIMGPDEFRLVAKDGSSVWIISNSQPIVVDGNFKGLIGVFTDITERKKREEERLEKERNFLHSQKLESLGILTGGIAQEDVMSTDAINTADSFLQKPFSLGELEKMLRKILLL